MSLTFDIESIGPLLRAIGFLDDDGRVVGSWAEDPIGALGKILTNPVQRAGLFAVLDKLLPPVPGVARAGSTWYPLLDDRSLPGNVYLTVSGNVVGVVAGLSTSTGISPRVRATVHQPLFETGNTLRPIAGTADGPLEIALDFKFAAGAPIREAHVRARVDLVPKASFSVVLEGVQIGGRAETLEISSASLGSDLVHVVETLLRDALENAPTGLPKKLKGMVDHFFGAVGLDGILPRLPIDRMAADPDAARDWLASIVGNAEKFKVWFAHIAGLLGAEKPTNDDPLAATLLSVDGIDLVLRFASANGELSMALNIVGKSSVGAVESAVTLLTVPLSGTASVRVVPKAHVLARVPATGVLVGPGTPHANTTLKVGSLAGGFSFDGTRLAPELIANDVVLEGKPYARVDLTDATSLVGVASETLSKALKKAVGVTGPGRALLALLGIVPPATDPGSTHVLDLVAFGLNPTAAIAAVHRAVLGDTKHDWSHMFAELATLLGFSGAVTGTGTDRAPWRSRIAVEGSIVLDLVAWKVGDDSLRIGLAAQASMEPWTTRLRSELLGFDLPASGIATMRVIGEQELSMALEPVPNAPWLGGAELRAGAIRAVASWHPGDRLAMVIRAENIRVSVDGSQFGPLTLTFPPADPSAPNLGLGIAAADLLALLRFLARHALLAWGGNGVYAFGELLGLFGPLGDDDDWPLLAPHDAHDANDVASLFARPGPALRARLARLAVEIAPSGRPFALQALAKLAALLRDQVPRVEDGFTPRLDVAIGGTGSYARPWSIPLDGGAIELVAWLEPEGPPPAWSTLAAQEIASAYDGPTLVNLALPERTAGGSGLDRLADWLAAGDGVVPLASQLPDLPGWRHGALLRCSHGAQPRDQEAITQIRAQLDEWADLDGGRAVLFLGPAASNYRIWDDLLAAADPGRPQSAYFDRRSGASPTTVATIASHYTADLDDNIAAGDPAALAEQISEIVDRVLALTGRDRVILVAHSTAGVAARVLGDRRPGVVRGIITLGTPHTGGALAPLTDEALSEALRVAYDLAAGSFARTPVGEALDLLNASLERANGGLKPAWYTAAPTGSSSGPPGLAIGSALGGSFVRTLAADVAARTGTSARVPPTHLAFGVRARVAGPMPTAGGLAVDATLRLNAGRVALAASGGLAEPPRPPLALTIHVTRSGSWLVGSPIGAGPRVRSATLSVILEPGPDGAAAAVPSVTLHDVALGVVPRRDLSLGDDGFAAAFKLVVQGLGSPVEGTSEALLVALGRAAGVISSVNPPRVDEPGLAALTAAPVATLRARRDALLDALADMAGGILSLASDNSPFTFEFVRATSMLRVQGDLPLADSGRFALSAKVDLATLAAVADAELSAGPVSLTYISSDGTVLLSAAPWMAPLVVFPPPPAASLRGALVPVVSRFALSSALSLVLSGTLDSGRVVGPLDRLFTHPGDWLSSLTGDDVHAILVAVARVLGTDTTNGLGLPGGFWIGASGIGSAPIRLRLGGSLAIRVTDSLMPELDLEIDTVKGTVVPSGSLTANLTLPGHFGNVTIRFTASPTGVGLIITPTGLLPITLLPTFSGFGTLVAAGTTSLLPHLLQAIVNELRPPSGPPTGLLGGALAVATTLGIYAEDAAGFEEPARIAKLASMLQPGFFERLSAPQNLVNALAGLFVGQTPLFALPLGSVVQVGDRIVWTAPLPAPLPVGAELKVELGIASSGQPKFVVGISKLDVGPLVIQEAHGGYDGTLVFSLSLQLDPGDEFAFFEPALELGVAGDRLSINLLPLGNVHRTDMALALAPNFVLTSTDAGAVAMLEKWGIPLVAMLLLHAAKANLDEPLWKINPTTYGPTTRDILESAGLIRTSSLPAALARPLPTAVELVLNAAKALIPKDNSIDIDITSTLKLSVENVNGRIGIRLKGSQDIAGTDLTATVRFGQATWLTAADDAGVTLFLIRSAPGQTPPVAIAPGLKIVGLGASIARSSSNDPLVTGPIEVGALGALAFLDLELLTNGQPALTVSQIGGALEVNNARVVLSSSDGDSFIQKVLPPEIQAPFSTAVVARQGRPIQVHGGVGSKPGAIELTFPINLDLHIARISKLFLAARPRSDRRVVFQALLSGNAALGPIALVVEGVGLEAILGSAGVSFGFKPPSGLALTVESGPVKGGGFIAFEPEVGQYSGALQLSVKAIDIAAIGLVNTRLPDNPNGYSFLVILAAQFPSIPLGFGFSLQGVGGIVGIHRRMDTEALKRRVSEGVLGSILFPRNPVGRIDTVLADLRSIFPIQEGRFVFGPMVKLSWGPSALLRMELAVVLDLPSPLRLAILGRMRLMLPTEQEALADIRLEVVGILDFDRQEATITAALIDSKLAGFTLTGDMAMVLGWGATKAFCLSMGGFFPGYPVPDRMPSTMKRLTLALSSGDNPRLRFDTYFAVTSNSVQFGAAVEVYAAAVDALGTFEIRGRGAFDALIEFEPFRLLCQLRAEVSVSHNRVPILMARLQAQLSGPRPWHAVGFAEFQVVVATVRVPFEITVGTAKPEVVQEVDLRDLLEKELTRKESWSGIPPDGAGSIAVLKDTAPGDSLVLHPLSSVTLMQRLMPFGKTIRRYGGARPAGGPVVFTLTSLDVGNVSGQTHEPILSDFAPGQFDELTEDEKLSRPAFEAMPAGGRPTLPGYSSADRAQPISMEYDERVLSAGPQRVDVSFTPDLPTAPSRDSALQVNGGIRVEAERYIITDADTFKLVGPKEATTAAQAHDARQRLGARDRERSVINLACEATP